jgi:hypothetical protein
MTPRDLKKSWNWLPFRNNGIDTDIKQFGENWNDVPHLWKQLSVPGGSNYECMNIVEKLCGEAGVGREKR